MSHPLELQYGLTAAELLDALNRRFRAKVALEGVVAEVQLEKHIQAAQQAGLISRYEAHDLDDYPDFTVWPTATKDPLTIECKNVRDADEAYRSCGQIVAYKVETQKTRAAKGDPASRFYNRDHFAILAVCLGKKTGNWRDFMFVKTRELVVHSNYPDKLAVMQRVPLPGSPATAPWFQELCALLKTYQGEPYGRPSLSN